MELFNYFIIYRSYKRLPVQCSNFNYVLSKLIVGQEIFNNLTSDCSGTHCANIETSMADLLLNIVKAVALRYLRTKVVYLALII